MDAVKFREVRDSLNSGTRPSVMIKRGNSWSWGEINLSADTPSPTEEAGLDDVEYNEVSPDGFEAGNLWGFIYMNQNCPAVLGYGHRSESEKRILKYIWKVNHEDTRDENTCDTL